MTAQVSYNGGLVPQRVSKATLTFHFKLIWTVVLLQTKSTAKASLHLQGKKRHRAKCQSIKARSAPCVS